jgi:methanogenic corrinoid protein MtbC1
MTNADFDAGPGDDCRQSLRSLIDLEIVPQLVRARVDQMDTVPAPGSRLLTPSGAMVAEFAQLCHRPDERACWDMLDRLVQDRYSIAELFLKLITPAARHLGDLWDQDRLTFAEVTLGLLRMQNMTHHYGPLSRRTTRQSATRLRIMVASAPGSQHLLGLAMVSEFFVSDGWDVHVEASSTRQSLLDAVHADRFDVLGLSVGLREQLRALPSLIKAFRSRSLNPRLCILLGGAALAQDGTAARTYGADAVCVDPVAATHLARQLVLRAPGAGHPGR